MGPAAGDVEVHPRDAGGTVLVARPADEVTQEQSCEERAARGVADLGVLQIGDGGVSPVDPTVKVDGRPLTSGYIALQAETAEIDFRKVELINLEGCTDKRASNFKPYIVKSNPAMCR